MSLSKDGHVKRADALGHCCSGGRTTVHRLKPDGFYLTWSSLSNIRKKESDHLKSIKYILLNAF